MPKKQVHFTGLGDWEEVNKTTEKMDKISKFIKNLSAVKKSCQIRLNLHEGNLSEKIEIKQSHHLKKEGDENVDNK